MNIFDVSARSGPSWKKQRRPKINSCIVHFLSNHGES
jgi:hypothetical protein